MGIWKNAITPEKINEMFRGSNMPVELGIEFTAVGDDFIEAKMPVGPKTHQPFGILHGGASCVLAETLGSVASLLVVGYGEKQCLGIEINANHLKAVRSGNVIGRVTPISLGGTLHVWEIRIRDEQENPVCVSRLTVLIREMKRERSVPRV